MRFQTKQKNLLKKNIIIIMLEHNALHNVCLKRFNNYKFYFIPMIICNYNPFELFRIIKNIFTK